MYDIIYCYTQLQCYVRITYDKSVAQLLYCVEHSCPLLSFNGSAACIYPIGFAELSDPLRSAFGSAPLRFRNRSRSANRTAPFSAPAPAPQPHRSRSRNRNAPAPAKPIRSAHSELRIRSPCQSNSLIYFFGSAHGRTRQKAGLINSVTTAY